MSYRAGFVLLLGEPNVGKSTLLNAVVGDRVAIVSAKPQTTRRRADGVISTPEYQMIVVDAPGWIEKPRPGLNEFLKEEALAGLKDTEVVAVCLGPNSSLETTQKLIGLASGKPIVVVVLQSELGWQKSSAISDWIKAQGLATIEVSAHTSPTLTRQVFLETVYPRLELAEAPLVDPEFYTTQSVRRLAAEVIQEQCFINLDREVPYHVAVHIRQFDENLRTKKGKDLTRITADLVAEREAYRPILIGKNGQMLRKLGEAARKELEEIVGTQVHLELFVKISEKWMFSTDRKRELGYGQDSARAL